MVIFRRHKILLAALTQAPRAPRLAELMGWLFLLRKESSLSTDPTFYDFVPGRYGPISFVACRDLMRLRLGRLRGGKAAASLVKNAARTVESLGDTLCGELEVLLPHYAKMSAKELRHRIRSSQPWFFSPSADRSPRGARGRRKKAVFTMGYEGKSVDSFLQQLLRERIERVIDVRSNPVSRKYGFSKSSFGRLCRRVGIDYTHLPELGIPSSLRSELGKRVTYEALFRMYERSILPERADARKQASELLEERASVLMCFEADAAFCHRGRLATSISAETNLGVVHL